MSLTIRYQYFEHLDNWYNVVTKFIDVVTNAKRTAPPGPPLDHPIAHLLSMLSTNQSRTQYLALQENFIYASLSIATFSMVSFNGAVPDLPYTLPSVEPSNG